MISGMIKGILENSETESLKINLLMSNKDREEFKQIYNEIKRKGKKSAKEDSELIRQEILSGTEI